MAEIDLKTITDSEAKIKAIREIAKKRRLTQEERNEMTAAKLAIKVPTGSGETKPNQFAAVPAIAMAPLAPPPPPKIEDNPIVTKLKKHFSSKIRSAYYALEKADELTIIINKESLISIAKLLKTDPELDFDYLADLCAVDYPAKEEKFEIVYHLYSLKKNHRIRIKVPLKDENIDIDTVSKIWQTANWHEREAYDLFGIKFRGHPDLRRILLPRNFDGFPLRKDFPLKGKEGDTDIMKYMDYYD